MGEDQEAHLGYAFPARSGGAVKRIGTAIIVAAGLALAVPSLSDEPPDCRGACETEFRQCQQSCAGADDEKLCMSSCRSFHDQCLASCE